MKTVLILHGLQGYAGIHWQQWLHDELLKRGYQVLMPELPKSDRPDRFEWLKTIKDIVGNIDPSDLIIAGHSLGVVTALDYIETLSKPVALLVSVSGFSEDYGSEYNNYFMKVKNINLTKIKKLIVKSSVIYGDNDPYVPQKSLKLLADGLGVEPLIIQNGGHLNTDSWYTSFPQVLDLIVG